MDPYDGKAAPGNGHMRRGLFTVFAWLLVLGVVAALPATMFALHVPASHLPRYALSGLLLAVGVGRLLIPRSRGWARPMRDLVLGVVAAAAVWLWLPPLHEVNLWGAWFEAETLADHVAKLRPGDRDGFERERVRRTRLKEEFPELRWRLERAEERWTERTNEAVARLTARVQSARAELDDLWRLDRYPEMNIVCERVWHDLHEEAASVGEEEALRSFCDYYRGALLLAKRAGKATAP